MTLEQGWAKARSQYQVRGYLTDTDLFVCGNDDERQGWLEAYRHYTLTYVVPPYAPTPPVETPWNVETWAVKPWELAQERSETAIAVPDVIFAYVEDAQTALKNSGFDSEIYTYTQCGYDPGRVCFQDPVAPATAVPGYCVVKLTVAE